MHSAHTNRQFMLFIWLSSVFVPAGCLKGEACVVDALLTVVASVCFLRGSVFQFNEAPPPPNYTPSPPLMAHILLHIFHATPLSVPLPHDYTAVTHSPWTTTATENSPAISTRNPITRGVTDEPHDVGRASVSLWLLGDPTASLHEPDNVMQLIKRCYVVNSQFADEPDRDVLFQG